MPDAPPSSDLRSDKDNKLISLSKQYNNAFVEKDVVLGKLDALLSEEVVYHADKVHRTCCRPTRLWYPPNGSSYDLEMKWAIAHAASDGTLTILVLQVTLQDSIKGRGNVLSYIQMYFGEIAFNSFPNSIFAQPSQPCLELVSQ